MCLQVIFIGRQFFYNIVFIYITWFLFPMLDSLPICQSLYKTYIAIPFWYITVWNAFFHVSFPQASDVSTNLKCLTQFSATLHRYHPYQCSFLCRVLLLILFAPCPFLSTFVLYGSYTFITVHQFLWSLCNFFALKSHYFANMQHLSSNTSKIQHSFHPDYNTLSYLIEWLKLSLICYYSKYCTFCSTFLPSNLLASS